MDRNLPACLQVSEPSRGSLTDVMYIFDEPSIGLHARNIHRINELLQKLQDKGNTVIDVGPHAGRHGGEIVYEGSYANLLKANTLTGRHIKQSIPLKDSFHAPTVWFVELDSLSDPNLVPRPSPRSPTHWEETDPRLPQVSFQSWAKGAVL